MFGRRGCCRCHRKRTEKDCEGKRDLSHREQYLKSSMLVRPRRREAAGLYQAADWISPVNAMRNRVVEIGVGEAPQTHGSSHAIAACDRRLV